MNDMDSHLRRVLLAILDGREVNWGATDDDARSAGGRRYFHGLRTLQWIASDCPGEGPAGNDPGDDAAGGRLGAAPAPPFVWGDLLALHKIGSGSYADVYLAWETVLRRCVALKLMRPPVSSSETGLAEGRLLARVKDPRVVQIYGADVHQGRAGLWMELVEGSTLADMVERDGPLSPAEAALVAREVSKALAAMHRHGLAHGDVKAGNVMRAEGGRIVLMDFGSARWLVNEHSAVSGTPLYMAPEVLRGGAPTERSDLYGLGVLLFYMVTGGYPVEAESLEELRSAHERGRRVRLQERRPDLPDAFVEIVDRALEAPERRFASAGEVDAMLRAFLSGTSLAAGAVPRLVRRRRWPAVLLGGLVAAFLLMFVARWWWSVSPPALSEPPLIAGAQLYAQREGRAVPLQSGHRIAPGDHLFLELEPAREAFVYVLTEDELGAAYLLFPVPGLELRNPLPPGAPVRLPGSRQGRPIDWRVTSAGGRDHILIVATPERQEEIEAEIQRWQLPADWQGVDFPLSPQGAGRLRGIAGLAEREDRDDDRASPPRRLQRLARPAPEAWSRHLVLVNPAP